MPQTIQLEDGTEQEVYTQEELDAHAAELADAKVAEVKESLELEKETELLEKEAELVKAQDELRKAQEKDINFKNLRNRAERTEEERKADEANRKQLEETVASLKAQVEEVARQPLEAAKSQFIANNIGNDKDLLEKFEHFYGKLGSDAKTVSDVNQALVAAFNAASGGVRRPDVTGSMTRTSVDSNFAGVRESGQESEASQEFGNMLGLTAEDKKNFGGALKTGSVSLFSQSPNKDN